MMVDILIMGIRKGHTCPIRNLLAVMHPMLGACMRCMAMCGNGAVIGTTLTIIPIRLKKTQKVRIRARAAFCGAAVGTPTRHTADLPVAATPHPTTATTSSASVLS
jgi:hypothetical protein